MVGDYQSLGKFHLTKTSYSPIVDNKLFQYLTKNIKYIW